MADTLNPRKLLTDFLVKVGDEETELVNGPDGTPIMVSKAEALARQLYLMAMGGTQERKNDRGETEVRSFIPNIQAAKLIREWTEGKPSENKSPSDVKGKRPERFDKNAGSRLARVLQTDVSTNNTPGVAVTVPKSTGLGDRPLNRPTIPKKART